MDNNKLKVLQNLDYHRIICCGLCEHGNFIGISMFGTCDKYTYKHKKHTGDKKHLSIHKYGLCKNYGEMIEANEEFFGKI